MTFMWELLLFWHHGKCNYLKSSLLFFEPGTKTPPLLTLSRHSLSVFRKASPFFHQLFILKRIENLTLLRNSQVWKSEPLFKNQTCVVPFCCLISKEKRHLKDLIISKQIKCIPAVPAAEPLASEHDTALYSCHPACVHCSNVCRETNSKS